MKKTIVVIPTYNEKENIKILIERIFNLNIKGIEILIVDDKSPDGTWKIVKEMGKKNKNIHLLLRTVKRGRGYAGKDGFIWALEHGADYIIEMDADLSHDPKYIPQFLEKIKQADVVLGSRLIKGGKDKRESTIRKTITKLANLYIRIMLGIKVKDCNSGYRLFTRKAMKIINPYKLFSAGPAIVQEVLFKAHLKGLKIIEMPIEFKERELGKSKLGIKQLYKSYIIVLKLKSLSLTKKL